jgi:hypothetical protein
MSAVDHGMSAVAHGMCSLAVGLATLASGIQSLAFGVHSLSVGLATVGCRGRSRVLGRRSKAARMNALHYSKTYLKQGGTTAVVVFATL